MLHPHSSSNTGTHTPSATTPVCGVTVVLQCAIYGNFSAPKAQEIVVSRGHTLELIRPADNGRLQVRQTDSRQWQTRRQTGSRQWQAGRPGRTAGRQGDRQVDRQTEAGQLAGRQAAAMLVDPGRTFPEAHEQLPGSPGAAEAQWNKCSRPALQLQAVVSGVEQRCQCQRPQHSSSMQGQPSTAWWLLPRPASSRVQAQRSSCKWRRSLHVAHITAE